MIKKSVQFARAQATLGLLVKLGIYTAIVELIEKFRFWSIAQLAKSLHRKPIVSVSTKFDFSQSDIAECPKRILGDNGSLE